MEEEQELHEENSETLAGWSWEVCRLQAIQL